MIASMEELAAHLAAFQRERGTDFKCDLSPALSARMNDAALVEALVTGLPMAQGVQHRIVRSRGQGAVLTAKVKYRQGMRMLDHFRSNDVPLTCEEVAGLGIACFIVDKARQAEDDEACFQYVYNWVCRNIRYVHTAPGQRGYERLVGAASVLKDRYANCQGFADVLYLLCGICGIECEYRCGRGERRLHVWNVVRINGKWHEIDASKGARCPLRPQS